MGVFYLPNLKEMLREGKITKNFSAHDKISHKKPGGLVTASI
jgi:hypothetical protein